MHTIHVKGFKGGVRLKYANRKIKIKRWMNTKSEKNPDKLAQLAHALCDVIRGTYVQQEAILMQG